MEPWLGIKVAACGQLRGEASRKLAFEGPARVLFLQDVSETYHTQAHCGHRKECETVCTLNPACLWPFCGDLCLRQILLEMQIWVHWSFFNPLEQCQYLHLSKYLTSNAIAYLLPTKRNHIATITKFPQFFLDFLFSKGKDKGSGFCQPGTE